MSEAHPLKRAIEKLTLAKLATGVGKTHQAVRKWQRAGRLPRTEWTGETSYAKTISELCDGSPTAEELLRPWPASPDATSRAFARQRLSPDLLEGASGTAAQPFSDLPPEVRRAVARER
jgi:hypothetical protein